MEATPVRLPTAPQVTGAVSGTAAGGGRTGSGDNPDCVPLSWLQRGGRRGREAALMSDQVFSGKIIVTGGAGFVGSALIWALNRRGVDNILVVDRLRSTDKWRNLASLRFDDYLEAEQLRERLVEGRGLEGVTCVFHLGACSSTTELDCTYLMDNNYGYTRDLASWALERQVRFVYASSAATYGDGRHGYGEDVPLNRLRPLNPYGYSKHIFDLYAQRRGWLERIVGLKYFNVFGPNEGHKQDMRSMVCKAFEQISSSGRVGLFRSHHPDYADGQQKRDFLYVKDAVAMTLHLAASQEAGLFNLGSGQASTWLDLIGPVFTASGREQHIDFVDMPEVLRTRYQYYTCADMTRFRATGYREPMWKLDAAVQDYVSNYLLGDARLGDEAG